MAMSDTCDTSATSDTVARAVTRKTSSVAGRKRREVKAPRITRTRAERGVARCVELMTSGLWQTGKSHALVAEELKASPRTAETWAATASKAIKLAMGDGEDIKTRLAIMLESIQQKALSKQSATMSGDLYDSPDLKAACIAIKTQAELLGLVTQSHKVDMNVRQYEELPAPALRARLVEQRAKIDEALSKLDAEHPELTAPALPAVPEGSDPLRLAGHVIDMNPIEWE